MSFTAFNAPIQQKPAAVNKENVPSRVDMKIVSEAFEGAEELIAKLQKLGRSGMFGFL